MQLDEFMARLPKGEFWVFGYGSLMWSPCFSYEAKAPGRAHGYHRALCILSTRYRGTLRRPGLVMGLCRGGSCWGMAFRIDRGQVRRGISRAQRRASARRIWPRSMRNVIPQHEPPRRRPMTRPGRRSVPR